MMPFGHSLLRHWWICAQNTGLLDEEDAGLLADLFDDEDGLADQQCHGEGGQRRAFLLGSAIGTGLMAIYAFSPSILALLSVFLLIFAFFAALSLYLSPHFFCWLWSQRVDARFRHFAILLRQRECAVFGLRHLAPGSLAPLPLRHARLHCLRQLSQFVRHFNHASLRLVPSDEEATRLLFNFVGDEMQMICPFSSNMEEEYLVEVQDTDLHSTSLKSLWQYHFLVRSEFIRLALFAFYRANFTQFCAHFLLVLRMVWATGWLHVNVKNQTPKFSPLFDDNKINNNTNMSRITYCRAQLEWALERMESLDDKCTNNCDVDIYIIAKCLEQVAASLRDANFEQQQKGPENGEGTATMDANDDDEWAVELVGKEEERKPGEKDEEEEDYQIFEFDLHTSASTESPSDGNGNGNERKPIPPLDGHGAMLRELGDALERRKEVCMRHELRALARARGVPAGELNERELDRPIFDNPKMPKEPAEPRPAVCRGPFGLTPTAAMGLSADTILAQRRAILEEMGGGGMDEIVEIGGGREEDNHQGEESF